MKIDRNFSGADYKNLHRLWNNSQPSLRNFFVDTDALEVRSSHWEHTTILPILATIMLVVTVFLLILFRQSPTMVASTVAGCLTVVGVYLILNSLHDKHVQYA